MIGNYNVIQVVDNDDGIRKLLLIINTCNNFLAYSQNGLKSDLVGHDNHHYNNIYAYLSKSSCFAIEWGNYYYNNTCWHNN